MHRLSTLEMGTVLRASSVKRHSNLPPTAGVWTIDACCMVWGFWTNQMLADLLPKKLYNIKQNPILHIFIRDFFINFIHEIHNMNFLVIKIYMLIHFFPLFATLGDQDKGRTSAKSFSNSS
jgi:hypothetical protein